MTNEDKIILHVDDDKDMCDGMRLIIESAGYLFEEAHTAEEGLRVYKKVNPDFIIVDMMMEEIDAGTNYVKELKLLGNTAPIYLLSSAGDNLNMSVDYTTLGFSGVFQKPVDNDVLLKQLSNKLK